jgi:hypothetical protein
MQAEIVERISIESSDEDQSIKESASPSVSQFGHSEFGAGLSFGVTLRLNKLKKTEWSAKQLVFKKAGLGQASS